MKRSTFRRNVARLWFCTSSSIPQSPWGMILSSTAWQNAETPETGTASSVSEEPLRLACAAPGADERDCRDFRRALGAFPESLLVRGTALPLLR